MVDQNIKWVSNNMAVSQFLDTYDSLGKTDHSSYKEEYDEYQKTKEEFTFEQFSKIKDISVSRKDVEKDNIGKHDALESSVILERELKEDITAIEMMTIKEIKQTYPLSIELIKQCAEKLNIADIVDENSSTTLDNAQKIILECNKMNALKANANNPMYIKKVDSPKVIEEKETTIFESLIQEGYIVVIDTCSLMHNNMLEIINHTIIPTLEKYKSVVYITDPIKREIEKKLKSKDIHTYHKAESARSILVRLGEKRLYGMIKNKYASKDFADAQIITLFTDQRMQHRMCLITNDNKHSNRGGLAGSVVRLSEDPNIKGILPIKVLSVSSYEGNPKLIQYTANIDSNFTLHENAPLSVEL